MTEDPIALETCVAALAAGTVTSVDLVRRGRDRIARLDGPHGLNCVITVAPQALAEARAADVRRASGTARGPLDGVPFTVKDCIETADLRTTHGSALFADWVPQRDATVVARLRAAGLVLLAKVNLDDFAGACFGQSSLQGIMVNPHDHGRMVSGSSGGSAVSVAVGYAPVSIGTDTGGSLRIPAALTGVATLRPTVGLVSRAGIFPRSFSQDTAGPMTTTVAGLALALDALVGRDPYDPRDPATAEAVDRVPDGGYGGRRLPTAPAVGVVETGLAAWGDDPDGPVLARFRELIGVLRSAGLRVVPLTAPPRELLDASGVIDLESAAAVDAYLAGTRPAPPVVRFAELVAGGSFTEHVAVAFARELGADRRGRRALEGYRARAELRAYTWRVMAEHRLDAVLYPSVQRVAAPLGVEQSGVFTRWSENTGFPAVGVPMGKVHGLPCSAELLGRPFAERELLAVAGAVEDGARALN
jgi:Asp-tRNA(Asn)/Glu-tRNA(Gln) amidotransferase A subunit family amidase